MQVCVSKVHRDVFNRARLSAFPHSSLPAQISGHSIALSLSLVQWVTTVTELSVCRRTNRALCGRRPPVRPGRPESHLPPGICVVEFCSVASLQSVSLVIWVACDMTGQSAVMRGKIKTWFGEHVLRIRSDQDAGEISQNCLLATFPSSFTGTLFGRSTERTNLAWHQHFLPLAFCHGLFYTSCAGPQKSGKEQAKTSPPPRIGLFLFSHSTLTRIWGGIFLVCENPRRITYSVLPFGIFWRLGSRARSDDGAKSKPIFILDQPRGLESPSPLHCTAFPVETFCQSILYFYLGSQIFLFQIHIEKQINLREGRLLVLTARERHRNVGKQRK